MASARRFVRVRDPVPAVDAIMAPDLKKLALAYIKTQTNFSRAQDVYHVLAEQAGHKGPHYEPFYKRVMNALNELTDEKQIVKIGHRDSYPNPATGTKKRDIYGGPYYATREVYKAGLDAVQATKEREASNQRAAEALKARLVAAGCTPETTWVDWSSKSVGEVKMSAADAERLLGQGNKILVDAGDVVQLLSFVDYDSKSPKLAELYDRVDALLPKGDDTNVVNSQPH
jgi:hypothetical protein